MSMRRNIASVMSTSMRNMSTTVVAVGADAIITTKKRAARMVVEPRQKHIALVILHRLIR